MAQVEFVNKDNLRIARENMGLTSVAASAEISASKRDVVSDWENGKSLPTWSQIGKLSKLYNISELLFFSNDLIQKSKVIPDYRVGINAENDKNVKKLVNLVVTRQKWLEKTLRDEGATKNAVQGAGKDLHDPRKLASLIAQKLEINLEGVKRASGRKQALEYLIEGAEKHGIFVGKTISYHQLEVEDLRGLFISNDYCPFIVVNRRDALAAQIFSFIHELAHVFRKSDAISNNLEFRSAYSTANPEEVLCNQVAAEFLLPKEEFEKEFYDKADINSISSTYKVSEIFIFYRLKDLGKIRREIQDTLEEEILAEMERNLKAKAAKDKLKEGGNYTNSMRDSNGDLFNRVVSKSYLENRIGYVEASNLLRFSAEKV